MRVIADLHIHSRHSQATGKDLGIDNLEKYARIKGIGMLGSGDFTVIALSEDRSGWAKIAPFREKLGLTALPLFHDVGSKMMFGAKVRGLPTTILIGRDGRELGRLTGDAEWDSDEAVALIRYYLGKP